VNLTAQKFFTVLVAAPDIKVARKVAKAVLAERVAACANIVPQIESHYWWEGKLESANECLIVFKTTRQNLDSLEAIVLREHPYDTPEIVATESVQGNERYLSWMEESVC
jgi:periplasmic divalent cation tolerance protein